MMKRLLSIAAAIILTACATPGADIKSGAAPGVSFDRYRTFTFVEGDVQGPGAITDKLVRDRVRYLIAVHLGKRGYAPAAPGQAADLGVNYLGQVDAAQRELMTGYPGLYEYRGGSVDLGGIGTMDYRKGTLIVDIFDRSAKQLVWRATVSEAFSASYTEDNWKKLDRALEQAFQSLPARR